MISKKIKRSPQVHTSSLCIGAACDSPETWRLQLQTTGFAPGSTQVFAQEFLNKRALEMTFKEWILPILFASDISAGVLYREAVIQSQNAPVMFGMISLSIQCRKSIGCTEGKWGFVSLPCTTYQVTQKQTHILVTLITTLQDEDVEQLRNVSFALTLKESTSVWKCYTFRSEVYVGTNLCAARRSHAILGNRPFPTSLNANHDENNFDLKPCFHHILTSYCFKHCYIKTFSFYLARWRLIKNVATYQVEKRTVARECFRERRTSFSWRWWGWHALLLTVFNRSWWAHLAVKLVNSQLAVYQ